MIKNHIIIYGEPKIGDLPYDEKRSKLIQAEHEIARKEAVTTNRYVLLNGLLHCPSGISVPMPWYDPLQKAETLCIVELLGGHTLPDFDP